MTIQLIAAFAIAFLISLGFGAWLVPFLRKIKAGQSIKEIGPTWHQNKAGTPTMGGIMFILATVGQVHSNIVSLLLRSLWKFHMSSINCDDNLEQHINPLHRTPSSASLFLRTAGIHFLKKYQFGNCSYVKNCSLLEMRSASLSSC